MQLDYVTNKNGVKTQSELTLGGTDGTGGTLISRTNFDVDLWGRPERIRQNYAMNSSSHWVGASVAADKTLAYQYFADGSVKSIDRNIGLVAAGTALPASGKRATTSFRYNVLGQTEKIEHELFNGAGDGDIATYEFVYYASGRLKERKQSLIQPGAVTNPVIYHNTRYDYNGAGELYRYGQIGSSGVEWIDVPQASQTRMYAGYRFDSGSVLSQDPKFFFRHDSDGKLRIRHDKVAPEDLTSPARPLIDGFATIYEYDGMDRLIAVTEVNGIDNSSVGRVSVLARTEFAYDAIGRRIVERFLSDEQANFDLSQHVFDGGDRVLSTHIDPTDGSWKIDEATLVGSGGLIQAIDRISTTGNMHTAWALADENGSIATWVERQQDSTGSYEWHTLHTDFLPGGDVADTKNDELTVDLPTVWHNFRNAGGAEYKLGLYDMNGSWYDPLSNRLIHQASEVYSTEANAYQYAHGDPVNASAYESVTENDTFWTRTFGGVQATFGVIEIVTGAAGVASCFVGSVITCGLGIVAVLHGIDDVIAGTRTVVSGQHTANFTQQFATLVAQGYGASQQTADRIGMVADLVVGLGAGTAGDFVTSAGKYARGGYYANEVLSLAGKHAGRNFAYQGGGALAGGGIGYAATGTFEGAMLGAGVGSAVGGITAAVVNPCFVAGTPVLVPDSVNRTTTTYAMQSSSGMHRTQWAAIALSVGVFVMTLPPKSKDPEKGEEIIDDFSWAYA